MIVCTELENMWFCQYNGCRQAHGSQKYGPKWPILAKNDKNGPKSKYFGHISGKNENMLMHIKNMW